MAREHRLLLIELAAGANAAGHACHQIAQALSVGRVYPARRQFGNQCIETTGLYLRDVGKPTLPQSLRVGNRACIEQHQPLDALTLPAEYLEREVAAERQTDQREPRRRMRK